MDKKRIIAIWGKCAVDIALATDNEAWPTDEKNLTSIGKIKNKTAELSSTKGESMELLATGGELADALDSEGKMQLKVVVVEPTVLYKTLGLTDAEISAIEAGEFDVKTHVVDKRFAARLTPQRIGGWGIKAPVTQVSFGPAGSEAEGGSAEVIFNIIKGASGMWYRRFTKKAPATPAQVNSEDP